MKHKTGSNLLESVSSSIQGGHLAEDVERLIGKAAALAGSAALVLGAFEQQAPQTAQRLNKDLLRTLDGASRSTSKLFKTTRRYLRKHPWQSAALVAAVG